MKLTIIGGGQLARMLALAGIPMGIECSFLLRQGEAKDCVKNLGKCVYFRKGQAPELLYQRLGEPDVVTIENEQSDLELLKSLSQFCDVYPNPESVQLTQNRISEKLMLSILNLNTARYFPFFNKNDLVENMPIIGFPLVIKAAEGGYDGKSQYIVKDLDALKALNLPDNDRGYIAEQMISFKREISFIGVRSSNGETAYYPATENHHENAILVRSIAPAQSLDGQVEQTGHDYLRALFEELNYVGVLAMECFQVEHDGQQKILINELAPRVHNSGHWTQAGALTNQFENHLRAIFGLRLGSTEPTGYTAMFNLLGQEAVDYQLLEPGASVHWYNKKYRKNRKMGHINICSNDYQSLQNGMHKISKEVDKRA